VENVPLSPRAPLSPVGRLTAYGKLAFGHLPTGLGKPAAGFPQPPSFDDDRSLLSMHICNCRHRTATDNFSLGLDLLFVVHASCMHNVQPGRLHHNAQTSKITSVSVTGREGG